jgi:hypothetical protein
MPVRFAFETSGMAAVLPEAREPVTNIDHLLGFAIPFTLITGWLLLHSQPVTYRFLKLAIGWAVLLIAIAALQFGQHYLATLHHFELGWLGPLNLGSFVLLPLSLLTVLYLYATDRPAEFISVFLGVIVFNAGVWTLSLMLRQGDLPDTRDELMSYDPQTASLWTAAASSKIIGGGLLTLLDIMIIVLVYRRVSTPRSNRGVRVLAPLLAALACDALGYSALEAVTEAHSAEWWFGEFLRQLVGKCAVGTALGVISLAYLQSGLTRPFHSPTGSLSNFVRRGLPL